MRKRKRRIANLNTRSYCNRCGKLADCRLVQLYIDAHYPSMFRVCPACVQLVREGKLE